MADLRGWPFPVPGKRGLTSILKCITLAECVCAPSMCASQLRMDRQVKAKEEVLEFGDNPQSGFQ